jgi:hypothetical protein
MEGKEREEEESTSSLHLLGKSYNIGRVREAPVLVRPEFARRATTSLHLVDDERHVETSREVTQALEEKGRRVVISTCKVILNK